MAYDAADKRVVLFGGRVPTAPGTPWTPLGDTWTWDGSDWHRESPSASPSARYKAVVSYDLQRNVVILFGGAGRPNEFFYDTWAWNGTTWKLLSSVMPPGFHGTVDALAYDETRQASMFFAFPGGVAAEQSMWFFDGTTWTRERLTPSTLPLDGQAMAYDEALGQIVEFGGEDAAGAGSSRTARSDTWGWNAHSWMRIQSGPPPPARLLASMAYDSARHKLLIFGGLDGENRALGDTWTLDTATWSSEPLAAHRLRRGAPSPSLDEGDGGYPLQA